MEWAISGRQRGELEQIDEMEKAETKIHILK